MIKDNVIDKETRTQIHEWSQLNGKLMCYLIKTGIVMICLRTHSYILICPHTDLIIYKLQYVQSAKCTMCTEVRSKSISWRK